MQSSRAQLHAALLSIWVGVAALCAGCEPGNSSADEPARGASGSVADGYPRTIRLSGQARLADEPELRLSAPPQRIVPANAGLVDFVSILVEPDRVAALPKVARDYSRLATADPAWLERPTFEGTSAEVLLGLNPDLVFVSSWQSPEATAILRSSGVPVVTTELPKNWNEVLQTLRIYGDILDSQDTAHQLIGDLESRREKLLDHPLHGRGLRVLSYSNLGVGGTAAGSQTTADVLFTLAGLVNAAAEAGLVGYVPLDKERLLDLDPQVIVVGTVAGDDGQASPTEAWLRAQPDLAQLAALRENRIVSLEPRLFTTTSFELLQAAERLLDALAENP